MRELYHELTDWTLQAADSDWAIALLVLVAFSESIVFPIPPDPLVIAIGVASPVSAIWVAGLATIASVAGAFFGQWLGRKFGRPLLHRLVAENKVERAEELFNKYGVWTIILAAITPIPYKVFAILAGVMALPVRPFLIASLIGRGARLMTIGVLVFLFGEEIQEFIEGNFELLTIAGGLGLVVMVAGYLAYRAWMSDGRGKIDTQTVDS